MHRAPALLALLLLTGLAFAIDCSTSVSRGMTVPAVSDSGTGQMVNVSIEAKSGGGSAYIATSPIAGWMTQASGQEAMQVATGLAGYNRSTCDVLIKFGSGELSNIDGPSAGAAMTTLILAGLKNETLRKDFTITGTIEPNGAIGQVGGVPEKAEAASEEGLKYFLVPLLGLEDRITLDALKPKLNITVIQVLGIGQAEGIANGSLDPANFTAPRLETEAPLKVQRINDLDGEKFSAFRATTLNLIREANLSIKGLPAGNSDYRDYFSSEVSVAENAARNGYIYTGANTAFIAGIEEELLSSAGVTRADIESKASAVDRCFDRVSQAEFTDTNWEWVAGAQVRASWAKKKVSEIRDSTWDSDVATIGNLKNAIYAEKWCAASEMLISETRGGKGISQYSLKPIASKAISEASGYLSGKGLEFGDEEWHLETAQQEFSDGLYAAAVYDASYAQYMAKGYDDSGAGNTTELLKAEAGKKPESVWASLYHSQFLYLRTAGDQGATSLQLAEFSDSLENRTAEMHAAFEVNGTAGPGKTEGSGWAGYAIIILMALTLAALVYALMKTGGTGKSGVAPKAPAKGKRVKG